MGVEFSGMLRMLYVTHFWELRKSYRSNILDLDGVLVLVSGNLVRATQSGQPWALGRRDRPTISYFDSVLVALSNLDHSETVQVSR